MSKARDLADGTFDTDTLVVDAANNRVGVGTASPAADLHIASSSASLRLEDNDSGNQYGGLIQSGTSLYIDSDLGGSGGIIRFRNAGGTERARIDTSGNLLVGKTATTFSTTGVRIGAGFGEFTNASDGALSLNRTGTDGYIQRFYKDGTLVGSIASVSYGMQIYATGVNNTGWTFGNGSAVLPMKNSALSDNFVDLGSASYRMDDIYATNGTIQTSDQNEKQDIAELDEAEKRVATAAKGLIRKFRWIDAVAEKGDDARIHVGVIAQDLQAAFEAEGLDAGRYAMFISSTWWEADEIIPAVAEELDEDGNVITETQPERTVKRTYETAEEAPEGAVERTRLGVRYPELLAFIIGAL